MNRYVLSAAVVAVLALSGASLAQSNSICHHPQKEESNHNPDSLKDNTNNAHFDEESNGNHDQDHPPGPDGTCASFSGGVTAVPEPITMLLFGAGLAGVGYAAKRRRERA
jgi:hypothetical protein